MLIEKLVVGDWSTNCYILSRDENAREAVVIDPAGDAEEILAALGARQAAGVLLTHGHFDHTHALSAFAGKPIYIHPADAVMLTDANESAGAQFGDTAPRPEATDLVQEGSRISLAGLDFTVLHLPGHTPGSVAYQTEDTLFTGDTLFRHAFGRTDLPGGSFSQLRASLRRLFRMEGDYQVCPGHGVTTTLAVERSGQ